MAERTVPAPRDRDIAVSREETREEEVHLLPPVDIYETDNSLVVVADMPGVAKDAVQVSVDDGVLTIVGRTRHVAGGQPVWSEYRLRSFCRQFQLSDEIDQDKISAELKNGVLTITLPKAEKAKPKQIDVNVA